MVVGSTDNSLKGTIVVSNCDKNSVSNSADTISQTLTQQVQTDTQNSQSQVQVNAIRQLSDGYLALDYTCHGVEDQQTAKDSLNSALQDTAVKSVILQPAATTIKPQPQPSTTTAKPQPQPSTTTTAPKNAAGQSKMMIDLVKIEGLYQYVRSCRK